MNVIPEEKIFIQLLLCAQQCFKLFMLLTHLLFRTTHNVGITALQFYRWEVPEAQEIKWLHLQNCISFASSRKEFTGHFVSAAAAAAAPQGS